MKISIDTRTIKKGDYFVPIKGPNFDGHLYIENALKKGARGIISEEEFYKIAKDKLNKMKPVVIGVAGSIGKSTFRSYLYSILRAKYKVLEGDQNTKIGLTLKIVNELTNQDIFIAEIGIDRLGEMEITSSFMNPDFAIITKLGNEHLEFLKSFKNVVLENLKIVKNSKLKLCYLNKKDKKYYPKFITDDAQIIYFPKPSLPKQIKNNINKLTISDHERDYLEAIYQIVSDRFKFTVKDFNLALRKLIKPKGRLNILKGKAGSIVIDDSYNAVCDQTIIEGVKFAMKIAKDKGKRLNLIISNMRENGNSKINQHKNVAKFINKCNYSSLVFFGDETSLYSRYIKNTCITYKNYSEISIIPSFDELYYIKSANYYKGHELVKLLTGDV